MKGNDVDYEKMTVAELKSLADRKGVKYTSKTRKIDLIRAIDDVTPDDTNSYRIADPEAAEVHARIVNRVMDEFPRADEFPSVKSAHRPIDLAVMGNPQERHSARMAKTKTSAVDKFTERRIIKAVRASQSHRYGQGDRGMGAKHFLGFLGRYDIHRTQMQSADATKMLSYGDRVRNYAKQSGQDPSRADTFPGPVLTSRQWRRLDKKDNRNRFLHRATKEARYV